VVDEEPVGLALREVLKAEGYGVELATGLPEALAMIERAPFDVLLLDLHVGETEADGFAVLRRLRDLSPRAVGIILTGRGSLENAIQAMRLGADDFLVKPTGLAEATASISRALHRRAQADESVQQAIRERTARAEVEAAYRHLHELFLWAPAMIAVLRGPEHVVELVNPLYLQAMGRPDPSDLLDKPLREARPAFEGQDLFERLDQVYVTGQPFVGHELPARIFRAGGTHLEERYVDLVLQPLRNAEGVVDGVFTFAVDVTEYVRARERAAELDRLKEEFITTASHDLKGPLTSIRGYSQLLLRRVRARAPNIEQMAQALAAIDAQTSAMVRLVDDLLDASRLQDGRLQLQTVPCDVGECLDSVFARLNPQERARVDVSLPDAPLAGAWDRTRIEQVLANVVGNALKYSPESERVSVAVARRIQEIEVVVGDRGLGIRPEDLPRLFERFHRTPQALASGLPGTGLGLYICRGIVEAHGGRIWAESAGDGQGARFRFTLPAAPIEPGVGRISEERRSDGGRGS
jgi:signal transduction histidine kinase